MTTVVTTTIQIPTADDAADGVLLTPPEHERWPGVLYLTDIGGLRPGVLPRAERLAAKGYAVLLPNAFYPAYNPAQADRAFDRLTALLANALPRLS